jgi:D-serine deaminase-like pyridoxal phosphate-dependent protein
MKAWYEIDDIETIDSPSIVLYEDRLRYNLNKMISMVNGNTELLMPHIKTNKMPKVINMMISLGIKNFKASTIAEAEIAANEGAERVLIAHQLVGPKIERFCALSKHFKSTKFFAIVDNIVSLEKLNEKAIEFQQKIGFYIDINSGMNRSGIKVGSGLNKLISQIKNFENLSFRGLHMYDGHIRDTIFENRKEKIEAEFKVVNNIYSSLKKQYTEINIVCGGTPSFSLHSLDIFRISSPGTCVLWDWGYAEKLTELEFKHAALLICRVISKPAKGIITIDLGHKSVAAENDINKRVKFLNINKYQLISQSEEHGVLRVNNSDHINVGDVLYGIPYHICPTINLHDTVSVIINRKKVGNWLISGRSRKINF